MGRKRADREKALLPQVPLLLTESDEEFAEFETRLKQEIAPRGIVEEIYVADFARSAWEVHRLRRCQAATINSAFGPALQEVMEQLLPGHSRRSFELEQLAHRWFTDSAAKEEVADLLEAFSLDESAIEAQAVRASARSLEMIERMLISAVARRDKALGCVTTYRETLAKQLRESADRILEERKLLEHSSAKRAA